jgi:hypothetical protein
MVQWASCPLCGRHSGGVRPCAGWKPTPPFIPTERCGALTTITPMVQWASCPLCGRHSGGVRPCAGWKPTPPFIPTHSPPTSDKRDTPLGSGVAERDSSPVYREISPRVDEEPTFRRVRHDSSSFPRTLHRPQRQLSAPTDMSLTSSRIATFQGSQAWHRRESRRDPANPGTTLNPRRRPTTRGWSRIRNRQRRPHPAAPQGSRSARRPTCPHSPR